MSDRSLQLNSSHRRLLAYREAADQGRLEQFAQCFPKFASENRELIENVYETYRTGLKDILWVSQRHCTDFCLIEYPRQNTVLTR